jgi:hypothetical protein
MKMNPNNFSLRIKIWVIFFIKLIILLALIFLLINLLPFILAVLGLLLIIYLGINIKDKLGLNLGLFKLKKPEFKSNNSKKPSQTKAEIIDVEIKK